MAKWPKKPSNSTDQPVHRAAAEDFEELMRLLENQPDLRDKPGWFGRLPLHAASSAGNDRSVEILLGHGADPNAEERLHHDTPLILAVESDSAECVKLLLEARADPNKPGRRGQTPIFVARSLAVLHLLVDAGAKPEIVDANGDSPFQNCASYIGSFDVLRFWIERNVNLNAEPTVGWPPLHGIVGGGLPERLVSEVQRVKILNLLLDHGASIDLKDKTGLTALFYASASYLHLTECVRLLLKRGADPNFVSPSGDTPLHMTVYRGNTDMVELLVGHGANPSIANMHHIYPVDLCKQDETIRQLLEPMTIKTERSLPTPESVLKRLKAIPKYHAVNFEGCTVEEITDLEERLGVKLPESYRIFLRVLGRGAGDFMVSDHWRFQFSDIPDLARNKAHADYCDLPDNAFVFAERCGYFWVFFIADGSSDDPPVFGLDDDEDRTYKQVARSVWEFVESLVIDYEYWFRGEKT